MHPKLGRAFLPSNLTLRYSSAAQTAPSCCIVAADSSSSFFEGTSALGTSFP